MSQTLVTAAKWARQHEAYGPGWAENYWKTRQEPSRIAVVEALKALEPWESLMELGCNSGPQLAAIREIYPKANLAGLDVNPQAILAAHQNVPSVTFRQISLWDWLPVQPAASWDVILSHYTLAYVAPEDLQAILRQCWRIARRGVLFAEPTATSEAPAGLVYAYPEWRHDYPYELERLGAQVTQTAIKGPGHLNALTVGRK